MPLCTLPLLAALIWGAPAAAQEPQWIWSPEHELDEVPHAPCYFRKTIRIATPQGGKVAIAADDEYHLYVNGSPAGSGQSAERLQEHDVSRYLSRGRNIIAIKALNQRGSTAGVAARVMIQQQQGQQSYVTDRTWKANLNPLPLWSTILYNDRRWPAARELGEFGETAPWDVRETVASGEAAESPDRFQVADGFEIEEVLTDEETGSLIAMTFNEFGDILASRAGGPLLLIYDSDDDGAPDQARPYCTKVENCQGILALNGEVFVTGDGPSGAALYRLTDKNRDGLLEHLTPLIQFEGEMGEHGPHGLTLGPDGALYVVVGNHAQIVTEIDRGSPHRGLYEGDLFPRYEDPDGYAVGVRTPGGVVLRTDLDGRKVERIAGGLRNAYDLAFNRAGELFVHDSDMESDIGTGWYRPTRLYHVVPGGEFGWRSGWAKWPEYYADVLPPVLETGRGSPTGAVFYNHVGFPAKYHDAVFLADWSEGRILAANLKSDGASYAVSSEVFVEGRPLNVTDLEVGPEGGLYFVTGGRGTGGGIYRVVWKGHVPAAVKDIGSGISAAIRQPQLNSAWARQKVATAQQSLGERWGDQLRGVARSKQNPWYYRSRALQLMHLFGPSPTAELLLALSRDKNEKVRAAAAHWMGRRGDDKVEARLVELLRDSNPLVRRRACESLRQSGHEVPLTGLNHLLVSDDRYEAWAARRLLERLPPENWRGTVLAADNHRLFVQGGLALLIGHPSEENSLAVLSRFEQLTDEFITDRDFTDMLRLAQVALELGEVTPEEVPALAEKLGQEFPSGDESINRELVRLLAYLQVDKPMPRYLAYLDSDAENAEKLHLAMHLRFLETGWQEGQRMRLLEFYEKAKQRKGGGSYRQYISRVERDLAKTLTGREARGVLARGDRWPDAALGVLYGLPQALDGELIDALTKLDLKLKSQEDSDAVDQLRVGILAVLARSGGDEAMAHVRSVWEEEPQRRQAAAMAMAQQPSSENWRYLLKSLPILEGAPAREVLGKLCQVPKVPENPEHFRQVILLGLEAEQDRGVLANGIALLRQWGGQTLTDEEAPLEESLQAWQQWYTREYPDLPAPELPVPSPQSKWEFAELQAHLSSDQGARGSAARGAVVFKEAQCVKCHRYGSRGESIGPDLTSVSKRFTRKEILEAIVYPSHVISDQYASKTVVTTKGRTYTGLVAPGAQGETQVLQSSGEKVSLKEEEIEEIVPGKASAMPAGLLDELTLEEISDLFAYLGVLPNRSVARRVEDSDS